MSDPRDVGLLLENELYAHGATAFGGSQYPATGDPIERQQRPGTVASLCAIERRPWAAVVRFLVPDTMDGHEARLRAKARLASAKARRPGRKTSQRVRNFWIRG